MARIRSIKPEFFLHDKLFKAEKKSKLPLRVAFPGLWTVADREGRFKWKVSELKLQILPHDRVDFEKVLQVLEQEGFIKKYVVNEKEYGFIPSWFDHQKIRPDEAKSVLPAPPNTTRVNPSEPVTNPSESNTTRIVEGKGKEGKGGEGNDLIERVDSVEKLVDQMVSGYKPPEQFKNKSEAFEYLKTNDFVIEDAIKTVSAKGWKAVDEVDVVGFIKLFVSAKAKMDQPPEEIKQHFRNWIFREPVDKLTEYAKTFKKSLPV